MSSGRAGGAASSSEAGGTRGGVDVRIPNWIGDAIMAAPTLDSLARLRPELTWRLWGVPRTLPLFEGLDAPFELQPLPQAWRSPRRLAQIVARVRRVRADAALVLPPSFSSALVPALAGTPRRFGWPGDGRRVLLTDLGPSPRRDRHLREQYRELGGHLSRSLYGETLPETAGGTRLPLRAEELVEAREAWAREGADPSRTLVLAPGATFGETKRWPRDRFQELGRSLVKDGWSLLWFGGPAERELCEELALACRDEGPDVVSRSLAGRLSLRQALARLAGVRLVVSNDSGAMHMAQASGVPVVGLFGSTSPRWTGPVGPDARVVTLGLACSPCFSRTCPTAIECLHGIEVGQVREAVEDLARTGRTGLRPAVFLDRDGTLIELVSYLKRPEEVRLVAGAGPALRALRAQGFALVLVTNQSVVARGEATREEVDRVHARLTALLRAEGVELDAIELCPHHPDFGTVCACRKPAPGMLLRAAHRLGLDLSRSWLIGDNEADHGAAEGAGVRFCLVRSGYGRRVEPLLPGVVSAFDDLTTASQAILSSLPLSAQE